MFIVVKKKSVIAASILLVVIVLSSVLVATLVVSQDKATAGAVYTVVLDAGHGGIDAGVKGVNSGTMEREVNLAIVLETKKQLEAQGIAVVLTRTDENGLYDTTEPGFKRRDFERRKEIIATADAQCVVSVHCNKFPDSSRRGAQCFFENTSAESALLASAIQAPLNTINERETARSFDALRGEYYMLKCTTLPSAIVECGFLSNPEDDALLNTPSYITELATAIANGILSYKAQKA